MLIVEQTPLNCKSNQKGGWGELRAGEVDEAGLKEKFSLGF